MKSVALAIASLVLAAGAAHAQPADPYGGPVPPPAAAPARQMRPMMPLRAALIARFDRNGDGRLEPNERRAAARALRKLARKLDRQARKQAMREQRLGAVIQRYDLNGDGNVDPTEMAPGMARRLQRLDRNRDGWVDDRDFE
jgi:glycine/D-amino acid oxidase-like deaminating enzyme